MKPIEPGCQAIITFAFPDQDPGLVGVEVTVVRSVLPYEPIPEMRHKYYPPKIFTDGWLISGGAFGIASERQLMRIDGDYDDESDYSDIVLPKFGVVNS